MVRKEILTVLKTSEKGAKSPKPKRPCPPKLNCMHFTSTSTCINFLSGFYFLTPMDIAHGPKGNFDHFEGKRKRGKISKTEEATHTKIDLHAFHINLYLHIFFERILLLTPMDYSPWSEGNFDRFEDKRKRGKISKTKKAMPTKIELHAFHVNLYLHNFLS